jgi:hypothetical protein
MVLFKNSYRYIYEYQQRHVNDLTSHSSNSCFGPSAYQIMLQVGGAWWMGVGIVWKNGYLLANRVICVCVPACLTNQLQCWASTMKSGYTSLNENYCRA